jgi:hypothetical protein
MEVTGRHALDAEIALRDRVFLDTPDVRDPLTFCRYLDAARCGTVAAVSDMCGHFAAS